MIKIDANLSPGDLTDAVDTLFSLAGQKTASLRESWKPEDGTPVFTVKGRYTSRGWTEWTQGFLYGMSILHFDGTGDRASLSYGTESTLALMAPHLTHVGVHDHGFNNVSTYGNLHRLMREGKIEENAWERNFYELALKVSGAVQAARWTDLPDSLGYICSFNGPHSLFIDTVRSLRILAVSHQLGHFLMGEQDERISLLDRLLRHAETTAQYCVYHGEGRDSFDVKGRVAHEAIFNLRSGVYRCPSSQQGYSPFSTWTRGLAWALCGFAEELEFLKTVPEKEFDGLKVGEVEGKNGFVERFQTMAEEIADFYIENTPADGIPYWDTGAPGLARLDGYLDRPADPYNDHEPVDSSAASIAAQGLVRLGKTLAENGDKAKGKQYLQAGLTVAASLFREPYTSTDPDHQGLILHSVYHRPNGWDYIPDGQTVPCGESSMWGDYHSLELALLIQRLSQDSYYSFFIV
ncbi:glycosyl hydrolase [Candidatus Poribacteria bacterium]